MMWVAIIIRVSLMLL
jgi:hypothetical protein